MDNKQLKSLYNEDGFHLIFGYGIRIKGINATFGKASFYIWYGKPAQMAPSKPLKNPSWSQQNSFWLSSNFSQLLHSDLYDLKTETSNGWRAWAWVMCGGKQKRIIPFC